MTFLISVTGTLLLTPAAAAQDAITSTVMEIPGKRIEVLGLQRWTPAMVQDSMTRYSPGDSLHSHACAAVLRYKLGFAEAASFVIPQRDGTIYAFVPVVEPQDSARVRHRALPFDTTGSTAPWAPLIRWAREAREGDRTLWRAVEARLEARALGLPPTLPARIGSDSGLARAIWAYLDAHSAAADARTARQVLATSPYLYDRVAAVAILSSFDREDATWHALVGALLEPDGATRLSAAELLRTFSLVMPRPVDWQPAARDLHAILDGGNFISLRELLDILVITGVSPTLASLLLAEGGRAVLMYAGASYPAYRGAAHRFLRVVSDRDYGGDLGKWREWIESL